MVAADGSQLDCRRRKYGILLIAIPEYGSASGLCIFIVWCGIFNSEDHDVESGFAKAIVSGRHLTLMPADRRRRIRRASLKARRGWSHWRGRGGDIGKIKWSNLPRGSFQAGRPASIARLWISPFGAGSIMAAGVRGEDGPRIFRSRPACSAPRADAKRRSKTANLVECARRRRHVDHRVNALRLPRLRFHAVLRDRFGQTASLRRSLLPQRRSRCEGVDRRGPAGNAQHRRAARKRIAGRLCGDDDIFGKS
jgi:hypothetical protein